MTPEERFWAKVQKTEGCWLWAGVPSRTSVAYGMLSVNRRSVRAHRFSWELHFGAIPKGMNVLHRCDNGLCVRPSHLFLGTLAENNADCRKKKRTFWLRNRSAAERLLAKARSHMAKNGLAAKGESVASSKLTANDVRRARKLHKSGHEIKALAKQLGVSDTTLGSAIHRKTWRHVD